MKKDERADSIIEQILKFTALDFSARNNVSEKGDEMDAIIAGLNSLGEELEIKAESEKVNEKRIDLLLELLLKYTVLDFSEKAIVSDKGDALDAIAAGVNSLSEELQIYIQQIVATNQELDSFTYSVSHDLRAPLRSIDGYSQVLLEDYDSKLDEEGKRTLEIIMKNAVKMGRLIDDLLAFSRLGKQNLTKVNIDMNIIVKGVMEEFKGQSQKKVEWIIQPLIMIKGDSGMLKQVITNLISNALKYSSKKENPTIEITSYSDEDKVIYSVKDNGAGFDMQYYDKLFGVFQRLHNVNEFEGTGVGLALVQRIIAKHGGKVWAEGRVGEGATFYFSLPKN